MRSKQPKGPLKPVHVRSTNALQAQLGSVLAALRGSSLFVDRQRKLSQEELVNASWLWMAEFEPEELARALAPHINAVEKAMRRAADEGKETSTPSPSPDPIRISEVDPQGGGPLPPGRKPGKRKKGG